MARLSISAITNVTFTFHHLSSFWNPNKSKSKSKLKPRRNFAKMYKRCETHTTLCTHQRFNSESWGKLDIWEAANNLNPTSGKNVTHKCRFWKKKVQRSPQISELTQKRDSENASKLACSKKLHIWDAANKLSPISGKNERNFLSKHMGEIIHLYLSNYNSFNSLLRQAGHMRGTNKLSQSSRKNLTHKWEGKC